MLCFDNTLLADYLDGVTTAETFLRDHESERWATPSMALFEAYMGAIYGHPRGTVDDVYEATRALDVLPVTDDAVYRAAKLQTELKDEGIELGFVDATLVATSAEHGATFVTTDGTILEPPVRERVDVIEYPGQQ